MAGKNCFDMTKIIFQITFVTVVHWSRSCLHVQINRVRLPATLYSVSCIVFFSSLVSFFNNIFPFGLFFLYSYCWLCWSCTWINIYFKLKSEVLFWKIGISRVFDLHTGQAYCQKKTISCEDMSRLLWNSWIVFNVSWHHDKQHTVHHKLY